MDYRDLDEASLRIMVDYFLSLDKKTLIKLANEGDTNVQEFLVASYWY